MLANAQRDGRPAEYRWRPVLNAAVWLTPAAGVPWSNAAKIRERKTWTQNEYCNGKFRNRARTPGNVYVVLVYQSS